MSLPYYCKCKDCLTKDHCDDCTTCDICMIQTGCGENNKEEGEDE